MPATDRLISGVTGYEMLLNTENPLRKGFFALRSEGLNWLIRIFEELEEFELKNPSNRMLIEFMKV